MTNQAHVVPVDDLIDHEDSEDCLCGPESRLVQTEDGDGWVVIHNSLDGRELDE